MLHGDIYGWGRLVAMRDTTLILADKSRMIKCVYAKIVAKTCAAGAERVIFLRLMILELFGPTFPVEVRQGGQGGLSATE